MLINRMPPRGNPLRGSGTGSSPVSGTAGLHRGLWAFLFLAVYVRHVNDGFAPTLEVFRSFEEAEEKGMPADILAMAGTRIGDGYAQKLNI